MFGITQTFADSIYTWSNLLLVVGGVLTLIGTAGAIWSGGVRERFSDERIAANEAETARAKADLAAAAVEQQRLKAQMAWRHITEKQARLLVDALRGTKIETWVSFVRSDPESTAYREDINSALARAGVKTIFFSGYERAVGLKVQGGNPKQRAALLQAFAFARIDEYSDGGPGSHHKNQLEVLVGSRPPPSF